MPLANNEIRPTLPNPYITTYMPIEKKTISQGALLMTVLVFTALLLSDISTKNIAMTLATIDTGTMMNSLVKYPIINNPSTYQDKRNILWSLIAFFGVLSSSMS